MTAVRRDLYIEQGATFVLHFQWARQTTVDGVVVPGTPYDLTGWQARMQIRADQQSAAILDATVANGKIVLGLDADNPYALGLASPVQANPTTATTGGTLAAGTYHYVVTAVNSAGESLASNKVSITTTGTTSTVGLSWGAVTKAAGYRVYRATSAAGTPQLVASVGNVTTYTDTGTATTATSPPPALDPTNGRIALRLTDEDTDTLNLKKAKYDFEVEDPNGNVYRLLQGNVTVDPNITQIATDPVVT